MPSFICHFPWVAFICCMFWRIDFMWNCSCCCIDQDSLREQSLDLNGMCSSGSTVWAPFKYFHFKYRAPNRGFSAFSLVDWLLLANCCLRDSNYTSCIKAVRAQTSAIGLQVHFSLVFKSARATTFTVSRLDMAQKQLQCQVCLKIGTISHAEPTYHCQTLV